MINFNVNKTIVGLLLAVSGVFSVMPADAAVAVRRQAKSKVSQGGSLTYSDTDGRKENIVSLGGAKSATFSEDAEGHSHLYVYDNTLGKEVEIKPEDFGVTYSALPDEVKEYKTANPTASYEEAFKETGYSAMWMGDTNGGYCCNADMFWECTTIYLAASEEFDSNGAVEGTYNTSISTTFRMTGGRLGAIIAAGLRYSESGSTPEKVETDKDKGTANIYISGGYIGYVAPSVGATKYFSGTVNIYMQNCHYTSSKIPNFYSSQDYCTSTIIITGVTYDLPYENSVLSTNSNSRYVSLATYSALQNMNGKTVTCTCASNATGAVTFPKDIQPVVCDTFNINAGVKVINNGSITTGQFFVNTSILRANTFTNYASGVVDAASINIGANATVYNLGTIYYHCGKFTCNGTWASTYTYRAFIGQKAETVNCNEAKDKGHTYRNYYKFAKDALLDAQIRQDISYCNYCKVNAPTYGNYAYPSTYDVTSKTLLGTLDKDVVFNKIKYTRNFTSTNYQALYLPYAMSYANWSSYVDLYRIKNVHEYDDDNDGTIDRWTVEIVKMKEGAVTEPNTPYIVKPKATGTVTFFSDSYCRIFITESAQTIDCSSTDNKFVFTGTPAAKTLNANKDFYMTGGALCYGLEDVQIGTYRWYMSIYNRKTGNQVLPANFNQAKKITVFCEEDGEIVTGILNAEQDAEATPANATIYDLNGRKVKEMLPGRIYIVNGKKVVM